MALEQLADFSNQVRRAELQLQQQLDKILNLDQQYLTLLEGLQGDDPERADYSLRADSDDGYHVISENASDFKVLLTAKKEEVEHTIQLKEKQRINDAEIQIRRDAAQTAINNPPVMIPSPATVPAVTSAKVKLPDLPLPKFNGRDVTLWPAFADAFQAAVIDPSLTNQHKLSYLKQAVTDRAAVLIQHLQVTAENYEIAWQMLKDRFDNKKMIRDKLIRDWRDLCKADPNKRVLQLNETRFYIDEAHRILLQSKGAGEDFDQHGTAILDFKDKLPGKIKIELTHSE